MTRTEKRRAIREARFFRRAAQKLMIRKEVLAEMGRKKVIALIQKKRMENIQRRRQRRMIREAQRQAATFTPVDASAFPKINP